MATLEDMPPSLKIRNKTNKVLYDHAWIAGVDYDYTDEAKSESDEDDERSISNIEEEYDEMDPDKIEGLATN